MVIERQEEILKFLVQTKEGKKYIQQIDVSCFDSNELQVCYDLLEGYLKKYATVPSKASMLDWFDRQTKKAKLSKEVFETIDRAIRDMYEPFVGDTPSLREGLVEYAQLKRARKMFTEYSAKLKDGPEIMNKMLREMTLITKMGDEENDPEKNRGGFVLRDHRNEKYRQFEGHPTYLQALNKMTAAGGFYTPQFIILMGAPKSFKTGTMLNFACEYMRDGLKVYYADNENGFVSVRMRIKQQMMNLTLRELISKEKQPELDELVRRYMPMGGDINTDFYNAYSATVADVDANLEYLRDEFGWVPDMICWDTPDKFEPIDPAIRKKDLRFKIQAVYNDIIKLNNKWSTFSFGVSQVNRNAVSKAAISIEDFAEDFGKAANAHAAFGICATPEEQAMHLRRIIPVMQREGVAFNGVNSCMVRLDEERMQMTEVGWKEATEIMKSMGTMEDGEKPRRRKKEVIAVEPKSIKDE